MIDASEIRIDQTCSSNFNGVVVFYLVAVGMFQSRPTIQVSRVNIVDCVFGDVSHWSDLRVATWG